MKEFFTTSKKSIHKKIGFILEKCFSLRSNGVNFDYISIAKNIVTQKNTQHNGADQSKHDADEPYEN